MKKNDLMNALTLLLIMSLPFLSFADTIVKGGFPVTSSSDEAVEIFVQGREAFEMGRIDDAIGYLNNAIQKDARFASAWLYKAYCSGTETERNAWLTKAVEYRSLASEGERLLIDIALSYSPNQPELRLELARKLAELYPGSTRAQLVLAAEYQERGQVTRSRNLIQNAVRYEPDSPLGYRALAASWLFSEPIGFDIALLHVQRFNELRPMEASSFIALGDVYRARMDLSLAGEAYTKALEIDPDLQIALAKRGYVNAYLGDFDKARTDFRAAGMLPEPTANKLANNTLQSFLTTSDGRAFNNETALTEDVVKNKVMRTMSGDSDNCYFCCTFISMTTGIYVSPFQSMDVYQCLARQFDTEAAVPDEKSMEANFAFVDIYRSIQNNELNHAIVKTNDMANKFFPDLKPTKVEAYNFLMGLIWINSEQYNKALNSFRKSDTENLCVKYNMAVAYSKTGRIDNAEKLFKEVADYDFANAKGTLVVKSSEIFLKSLEEARAKAD